MKRVLFILASLCFLICLECTENTTVSSKPSPETTTIAPLKCSRDYHCPSKCDSCLSGICTHQLNLNCTRDYHCPACEVCRSGKCIEGENARKCETTNDCDAGGWCLDSKCIENKCHEDADCGVDHVICKLGKCEIY